MKAFQAEIPKRNQVCSHDEKKFSAGMDYYSVLYEDEKFKIMRKDFCKECWEMSITSEMLEHSRGYWKSSIEGKQSKPVSTRAEKSVTLIERIDSRFRGITF